ncbi:MAG: hypothetical protein K6E30_03400 [Lachnospiraceae bacterium]|nr:hypothetical protein [Lachnospiraceae bacterium]
MGFFEKALKSIIGIEDEPSLDYTKYEEAEAPSGFSWGPKMPDEPNQFNYGGHWKQYFQEIFEQDFPQYELRMEQGKSGSMIYMLRRDGFVALYVEVMDDNSEANAFRERCRASGIPYIRFYHNHQGWWNTRRYVCLRARMALES